VIVSVPHGFNPQGRWTNPVQTTRNRHRACAIGTFEG